MKLKQGLMAGGAAIAAVAIAAPAAATPTTADVMVIMDESGSMRNEQAFIGGAMTSVEAGLISAGLTGNRYGNVGFGASSSVSGADLLRKISVGGGDFGTAAEFDASTANYSLSGFREDGWAGINFALTKYTLRPAAARNFILITDEDRDNTNGALSYASILSDMLKAKVLLNAVVNARFICGDGTTAALGLDSSGTGYVADGSGGFTTCKGASATSGFGTTLANYVDLALATGGAAWNLNFLRAGGMDAASFSAAFIAIKIKEITTQVPAPGMIGLLGLGVLGLAAARRRRA